MTVVMPELEGVEHDHHDLPTGVRIHVATAGPADAPVVLAQHGWPQHWWSWREVIAALRGDVRVVCPDMRGFGWSGWPADGDFTKARVADDLLALLDALGLERVLMAGHDWGGWAGFLAVLRAPERFSGLVAMSIPHPWQPPATIFRNVHRLAYQIPLATPLLGERLVRDGRFPRAVLETARRDDRHWRPEVLEAYLAVLREPQAARASERLYRDFLVREAPRSGAFTGQRLEVPSLLLHGYRDPLGRDFVQGFERHAEEGALEIVDRAGHFLPEEAPALVAERLRAMCG